ncbi:sulfotransferase family protein [Rhizorhabdus dicambivorans]|uniref:Sulfotransferase n=1 Tax=Rhizorhabdus dicambivorans TaxID=1850238 RepID=A0A2A4FYZ7_9SPHN|nr:sulfotransferase [Rhizorhabdus dicambivorans]ATE66504.1 sulfotransferase [Rhizorhabdus dicambivorans]PCE44014.1 sulfotransferase [Rhizorhabdus dicambivorans]
MTLHDPLRPEAMLAASAARTGLSDFGDPAFREGLDLLLADIRALDLAEPFVQATAFRIGQFLDARAMAVDGLRRHADVLAMPIRQPLIIAGLVRSGTTALHQLLSLDPQFQGPEHWLTVAPMPRPPRGQWPSIPQYRAVSEGIAAFIASAPEMLDDHMMSAEGIEESLFILATGFASNMWPSMWPVPRYDGWYRDRDDRDSYRWLADVLRLIGKDDDRRWLLKNPTDLFSLREVLDVFPDAMIVQTHRDPVEALPSICNLILAAQRVFAGERADPEAIGRREAEMWAVALDRAEQVRSQSDNRFFDIEFSDFTRDQLGTVKRLYQHFGLTLTAGTEAVMQAWLDAHPRRAAAGPRYRPEDFGLTAKGLRQRFADYRARRGYA